jgi:hypothetical protein
MVTSMPRGGRDVSRSLWRCRDPGCLVPHGAILGRVTADGGLVLDPGVRGFRCYMDTRRAVVECPACGTEREFRGSAIASMRAGSEVAS